MKYSRLFQALVSGDKKINLPILQCHGIKKLKENKKKIVEFFFFIIGNRDPVVEMQWGRLSEQLFKTMGFKKYIFKEYDGMVHSSSDQVITI